MAIKYFKNYINEVSQNCLCTEISIDRYDNEGTIFESNPYQDTPFHFGLTKKTNKQTDREIIRENKL